ncbi:MAG: NADH:ubiquinone reductase (Na(+)-transporting) subunit A [Bacteroidetes bacterium 4572_112]|nr:MAG: NADH:ubiquinone reductase (Na(+)-transporting) subunit A [Bacteroidetes bacterium 4572_112]
MSMNIKIKKGYDIKLVGTAQKEVQEINTSHYALKPTDFHGMLPKLSARVGDKVKRGAPVFFDKKREYVKIPSPVSGTITEIVRGAKRKMLEIKIEADGSNDFVSFGKAQPSTLDAKAIKEQLLESGLWSLVRQRPYTVVANPEDKPKSVFISGFDSAPLAADLDFSLAGLEEAFQAGVDALAKLTEGKVNLGISSKTSSFLKDIKNVEINTFSGPHPAGNVGIQIHHVSPINKGEIVWVVQAQDVATIGNLFLTGEYKPEITIALTGSEVKEPQYYKVNRGACIAEIIEGKLKTENPVRIISGNVLTGSNIGPKGSLSYYHNSLTVIPEGNIFEFFGWLIPSPKKHSFYRTAFSWLSPNKEYTLNTNMNGGERAFVFTGQMEKVFPMDIYPIQLIKSIMINDIDMMENLGIYEVDEEDIALCEYISTSKIDIQKVLREGLDELRKEMS